MTAEPWIRPRDVHRAAAEWTGLDLATLVDRDTRKPRVLRAGILLSAALREGCGMSLAEASGYTGRDRRVVRLATVDPEEVRAVVELARKLRNEDQ